MDMGSDVAKININLSSKPENYAIAAEYDLKASNTVIVHFENQGFNH